MGIRRKIGPYIAYIAYFFRTRVFKHSWKPQVLSLEDTIKLIAEKKLSVVRIGDGEISLFSDKATLAFQEYDSRLAEKLSAILKINNPKLLVCIPGMWGRLDNYAPVPFWFTIHYVFHYGSLMKSLLSDSQIYGDTLFTRPYLTFKDRSNSGYLFEQIKSLWKDLDVVLIEGSLSRLGVGNDLFDGVQSMQRILCPPEHAFRRYEEILAAARKVDKKKLILLSLGPTAKGLALDLFNEGYRVLDIGHIDMEYEMFLRGEDRPSKVQFKYFNEADERNPEDCTDPAYLSQIVAKIIN